LGSGASIGAVVDFEAASAFTDRVLAHSPAASRQFPLLPQARWREWRQAETSNDHDPQSCWRLSAMCRRVTGLVGSANSKPLTIEGCLPSQARKICSQIRIRKEYLQRATPRWTLQAFMSVSLYAELAAM
jgi:hypothetical protein